MTNEQGHTRVLIQALKEALEVKDARILRDVERYDNKSDIRFVEISNSGTDDGTMQYLLQARFSASGDVDILNTTTDFETSGVEPIKHLAQHVQMSHDELIAIAIALLEWEFSEENID